MCSDAETEPPGAPAQLQGEGRKGVALWERDLKSGGKKGGGTRRARLGAGFEEGGGGEGGEGDRSGPPTLLEESRSSPGPRSGSHPVPDTPGASHHCGTFS